MYNIVIIIHYNDNCDNSNNDNNNNNNDDVALPPQAGVHRRRGMAGPRERGIRRRERRRPQHWDP